MFKDAVENKSIPKDNPILAKLVDILYDFSIEPRATLESKEEKILTIIDSLLPYLKGKKTIKDSDFCNSENIFIKKKSIPQQSIQASLHSNDHTNIEFTNISGQKLDLNIRDNALSFKIHMNKSKRKIITTITNVRSWSNRSDEITKLKLTQPLFSKKHSWKHMK